MRTLILLFLLVSCGSEKDNSHCVTREEAIIRCQAEEFSKVDYPTDWEIQFIERECKRQFVVQKCY